MAEKYRRKPDLIAADMDGETVMMDIMTGKYYNLGRTGGAIWNLIDEAKTLDEIVDELLKKYDVGRAECEKQTKAFLMSCADKGIIDKEDT